MVRSTFAKFFVTTLFQSQRLVARVAELARTPSVRVPVSAPGSTIGKYSDMRVEFIDAVAGRLYD
eukprot:1813201-Prymnesium_polylepis.1